MSSSQISVGVTGAALAVLPTRVSTHIYELLSSRPTSERAQIYLVHGGAIGVDALWAEFGHRLGYPVYGIIPAKRTFVDPNYRKWSHWITEMPEGTDYRQRNMVLLSAISYLIGYPLRPEADRRSHRSGTWMTLRLARGMDIPSTTYTISNLTRA